jgi:hypothetical protein
MRDTLLTKFGMDRGRLVGHLYLGSKLAGVRYPRRPNSSPNNVGHRQDLIAVGVPLGRVRAWLLTRNRLTPSGNESPHFRQY